MWSKDDFCFQENTSVNVFCKTGSHSVLTYLVKLHVHGLVQGRSNSIANTLELHLSCTNPSMCSQPYLQSSQRSPRYPGSLLARHSAVSWPLLQCQAAVPWHLQWTAPGGLQHDPQSCDGGSDARLLSSCLVSQALWCWPGNKVKSTKLYHQILLNSSAPFTHIFRVALMVLKEITRLSSV